jgi:hypothetical protein
MPIAPMTFVAVATIDQRGARHKGRRKDAGC